VDKGFPVNIIDISGCRETRARSYVTSFCSFRSMLLYLAVVQETNVEMRRSMILTMLNGDLLEVVETEPV
jgi:hypothetical protein